MGASDFFHLKQSQQQKLYLIKLMLINVIRKRVQALYSHILRKWKEFLSVIVSTAWNLIHTKKFERILILKELSNTSCK